MCSVCLCVCVVSVVVLERDQMYLYTNTVPPLHLLSTASSAGGMDKIGEIRSLSNKSATWETTAREDSVRHAAQVTVSFKPTKYVNKLIPSTLCRPSTGTLYSNPFSNTTSSTPVSTHVSTPVSNPSCLHLLLHLDPVLCLHLCFRSGTVNRRGSFSTGMTTGG